MNASNSASELQRALDKASHGHYRVIPNRVFRLDEIVEAHRYMEANQATGKIVVKVSGPPAGAYGFRILHIGAKFQPQRHGEHREEKERKKNSYGRALRLRFLPHCH